MGDEIRQEVHHGAECVHCRNSIIEGATVCTHCGNSQRLLWHYIKAAAGAVPLVLLAVSIFTLAASVRTIAPAPAVQIDAASLDGERLNLVMSNYGSAPVAIFAIFVDSVAVYDDDASRDRLLGTLSLEEPVLIPAGEFRSKVFGFESFRIDGIEGDLRRARLGNPGSLSWTPQCLITVAHSSPTHGEATTRFPNAYSICRFGDRAAREILARHQRDGTGFPSP